MDGWESRIALPFFFAVWYDLVCMLCAEGTLRIFKWLSKVWVILPVVNCVYKNCICSSKKIITLLACFFSLTNFFFAICWSFLLLKPLSAGALGFWKGCRKWGGGGRGGGHPPALWLGGKGEEVAPPQWKNNIINIHMNLNLRSIEKENYRFVTLMQ